MKNKPYIKPVRQRITNKWFWTWRCPRTDHDPHAWCGGLFKSWRECGEDLERHWRTHHA